MNTRRRLVVAIGALVVCAVVGGVALAGSLTIGSGGVIQGCYDGGGNLKVVNALPCPKGFTGLSWNQTGVPGAAGKNGVSGREVVQSDGTPWIPGTIVEDRVDCPTGKVPTGGGFDIYGQVGPDANGNQQTVLSSGPSDVGWVVTAIAGRDYQGSWSLAANVVCVSAT